MASSTSTIKMESVEWLQTIAKDITLHIESASDVLVMGANHYIMSEFHTNSAGYVSEIALSSPTASVTITKSLNTVTFSSAESINLNVICKKGKAYFM